MLKGNLVDCSCPSSFFVSIKDVVSKGDIGYSHSYLLRPQSDTDEPSDVFFYHSV